MKLSIITVNLNNAAGLEKTAESIVSQTFTDFEWIVIDGGSTDGSVDVIRKYEDRITYWVSEKDSGIYNAMNKGVKVAKGEYLQFLNSGDCLADKNVVADFNKFNSCCSIIYGDVYQIQGNRVIRKRIYGELSFLEILVSSLSHQSSYILRDLLIRFPYNENYKIVSDWEFWIKMILGGQKFQHFNRFVSCYDMNGISETNIALNMHERQLVFDSLVPDCILYDYRTGKIAELIELKRRYPIFSKFITFCTVIMSRVDKHIQKCRK